MTAARQRIEQWFESLGDVIFRHRWLVLVLMVVMTVPMLMQIPKLTIDVRTESYFLENDSALQQYNAFRDQFGMDEFTVIAIGPTEVFELDFLARLQELHQEMESKIPYVDEVTSLINARNTRGEGDTLLVEELMERWPADQEELAELRSRVLSNPLYVNNLISEDATFTTIVVKAVSVARADDADPLAGFDEADEPATVTSGGDQGYLTSDQHNEMVEAIIAIVEGYDSPAFPIHLAGGPVVSHAMIEAVPKDLMRLMPLASILVVLFLALLFRRVSGVIYPILVVDLALLSTLGIMGILGLNLTNLSSMLTSFLLVVGIADAVHILAIFYPHYREHGDKRAAIVHALGHSGLAVLMTSITTAAGLLSFVVADVKPVADLGIAAPIGIGLALVYTVVLLPAMIAIFPMRRGKPRGEHQLSLMDRLLASVARISCAKPVVILAVALVITIVSVAGMTRLRFSQNGIKWFKESSPIRQATELIDDKLRGTLILEVVIDTGQPNGLYEPELLQQLERSMAYVEGLRRGDVFVGKASSLDTIVKEINRALNENQPEHYTIPDDRNLIAQELLLFEGSGSNDLEQLVDPDFSMVRCTLKVPFIDAFYQVGLIDDVSAHLESAFPQAEITITGSNALYVKMFHNIITTMAKSYMISLSIITLLMIALIGRVRIGLLSMIPNLLPLVVILGAMGWLDIPLDMSTVLIGSVAIGLVVDDTIHFMHNFRRYFEQSGSVEVAVARTMDTAGRAIMVTSIVLAGGFYISVVSELRSSVIFGSLVGTTVILALAADYFVTPALMKVVNRQLAKMGPADQEVSE
jgi:predicted RND superfamily exporter protein